jgi:hypothetical protein
MAHGTRALAEMQKGIDTLQAFYCHNMHGCPALGVMGTGIMRGHDKDLFKLGLYNREIDYVVFSYETPIAWHYMSGSSMRSWYISEEKYSVTTSTHQRAVRVAIDNPGHYTEIHEHVAGIRIH